MNDGVLGRVHDADRGYTLVYTGGTYIRICDKDGRELAVQSQGDFAENGEIPVRSAMLIMLRMADTGEYLELIEESDGNFDDFDKLYH